MTARVAEGAVSDRPTFIPARHTAAFKAGLAIYEGAPMIEAELFQHVSYCRRPSNRRRFITDCLESNWLIRSGDKIDLSPAARAHLGQQGEDQPEPVSIDRIAGIRDLGSVYARPPLSKRNMPNSRGFRDDVPEYSVRVGQSFRTVA